MSCNICLENLSNSMKFCNKCTTKFDKECLLEWFIYKGEIKCPICRENNTYSFTITEVINYIENSLLTLFYKDNFLNVEKINNCNKILSLINKKVNLQFNVNTDLNIDIENQEIRIPIQNKIKKFLQIFFLIICFYIFLMLLFITRHNLSEGMKIGHENGLLGP
jgi:ATP-dependent Zn protease